MSDKGMRIAKRMADAGLCSRREAERWIEAGRVAVNGTTLTTPACVVSDADTIEVDDSPLPQQQQTRLWLYHKPAGLVTTARDPQGRPTVFESLPENMPRVVSVGRLDLNSEGLLLLTTSGELAEKLMHPRNELPRTYKVRVFGRIPPKLAATVAKGVTIEGIKYRPMQLKLGEKAGKNQWVTITLHEGKNREIRKVMNHFGLQVNRLLRTSYADFELGKLKAGDVQEVTAKRIEKLGESLK